MRLYVKNINNEKIILDITATSRKELVSKIGYSFHVKGEQYTVNEIFAEPSGNNTVSAAFVGGLIGLIGGSGGVIAGGILGGLIGSTRDDREKSNIKFFNESIV